MVTICTQCVDDGDNGLVYCVDCLQLFGGNKPEESPKSPALIESQPPSPVTHDDISPPSPVLAKPVEAAVWSGRFKVHEKEIGDFVGHLSDMAGPEADGAVKLLKPLVRLRKLEMSFMLPKDLENSKFTDRSIDVFFFPSNESSQKALDELADDLLGYSKAMKAFLGKAELLVFSSMELPRGQWRYKGKYFFWGIFRSKYVLKRKKENIEEDVIDDSTPEAAKNVAYNVEEMEGTRRSKRTINKPIRMSSYHEGEY